MKFNINKIVSHSIFLSVTFLPALYWCEYIQTLSYPYQFLTALGMILSLTFFQEVYGKPFYSEWNDRIKWKYSPAERWFFYFVIYAPLLISSIAEQSLWTTFLQYNFVFIHTILFIILRIVTTGFQPLCEAPGSILEYVLMFVISLPIAAIFLAFHYTFSVHGLITLELFAIGMLHIIASILFCMFFTSATIYYKPLQKKVGEDLETTFVQNPNVEPSELSRIHQYLESRQ